MLLLMMLLLLLLLLLLLMMMIMMIMMLLLWLLLLLRAHLHPAVDGHVARHGVFALGVAAAVGVEVGAIARGGGKP